MTLNNQNGITYYRQIADIVITRVYDGIYPLGNQLPSARELSDEFQCNRHTIRRALDLVESENLIYRRQGRGTFVVDALPKRQPKTELSIGLIDISHALGSRPPCQLLSSTVQPAQEIANQLQIDEDAEVIFIHRLRFINKLPAIVEYIYIPLALTPTLQEFDLSLSLRKIMKEEFGLQRLRNDVVFESVLSTAYISELLDLPVGSAMMLEKRTSFSVNDVISEYSEHIYRGDQFSFVSK